MPEFEPKLSLPIYTPQLLSLEDKEAFDLLDEDKDGLISVDDLAKFMRMIGMTSTNAELSELVLEFDSDGECKKL